jgi:hypothetical protein
VTHPQLAATVGGASLLEGVKCRRSESGVVWWEEQILRFSRSRRKENTQEIRVKSPGKITETKQQIG